MPRGLGDSPLKREKKLRRTSPQASRPSSPTPGQASATPSGPGDLGSTIGPRVSYNDVFFQRRPETTLSPAVTAHEETHIETPLDSPPQPIAGTVPSAVTVYDFPVEDTSRPVEVTSPLEATAHPIETVAPVEEVRAEPIPLVAEPQGESSSTAPASPAAEATTESTDKRGFFGRIFGKWHR